MLLKKLGTKVSRGIKEFVKTSIKSSSVVQRNREHFKYFTEKLNQETSEVLKGGDEIQEEL